MWILLARAKNAKRLALNSRHGMLISRMIHGASLRIARGSSRSPRTQGALVAA